MVDEWWFGKDVEGSGRGLIEALFRHLPGGTEKMHEESQDSVIEIRTEHLPIASQELYSCANLFGLTASCDPHNNVWTNTQCNEHHATRGHVLTNPVKKKGKAIPVTGREGP
jgi:hypothetical protein